MVTKKNRLELLFNEIRLGNSNAYDELFLRYYDKLVAFAFQYTGQIESAEEITSNVLIEIWHKRKELFKITNPEVYLFIMTKNGCSNWTKEHNKRNSVFSWLQTRRPLACPITRKNLEEKEFAKLFDLTIASLPHQRKIIFKLIKEETLSTQEAAEILGIPTQSVNKHLHAVLITLTESISADLGPTLLEKRQEKEQFLKLLAKKLINELTDDKENLALNAALGRSEEFRKLDHTFKRYFSKAKTKSTKTDKLKSAWATINTNRSLLH